MTMATKAAEAVEQVVELAATCSAKGKGWACDRDAKASGMCWAHYQQQHRGVPLKPIRAGNLVHFNSGPRVSVEAAEVIRERAKRLGIAPYQIISRVMEAWAKLPAKARTQFAGLEDNRHPEE